VVLNPAGSAEQLPPCVPPPGFTIVRCETQPRQENPLESLGFGAYLARASNLDPIDKAAYDRGVRYERSGQRWRDEDYRRIERELEEEKDPSLRDKRLAREWRERKEATREAASSPEGPAPEFVLVDCGGDLVLAEERGSNLHHLWRVSEPRGFGQDLFQFDGLRYYVDELSLEGCRVWRRFQTKGSPLVVPVWPRGLMPAKSHTLWCASNPLESPLEEDPITRSFLRAGWEFGGGPRGVVREFEVDALELSES